MSGIYVKSIIRLFLALNIPLDALLRDTNLDIGWYNDPHPTISLQNYLKIISNALVKSNDESIGLQTGKIAGLSELNSAGIFGYAILSSRTVGEAVNVMFRFWKLSGSIMDMSRRLEDDSYEIWEIRPAFKVEELTLWRFLIEDFLVYIQNVAYVLTTIAGLFHKIILSYPEPSYLCKYYQFFSCPITFDNEVDAVYVPKNYFDIPTSTGQPQVLQTCIKQCEESLAKLTTKDRLIESIRNHIVSSSFRILRLEQISEELGMSVRTLQRKLHRRDTTFQKILKETRQEIAGAFLSDTDLTIDQISDRLGFSDSSNFRKSFKKWTGTSPRAFRSPREASLL